MKQLFRVLPIVLSVGLFGCGNNANTTATTESATPAVPETKEEFVSNLPDDAPIVKVASDTDFAPYDFKDEYGNVTGFDIELMRHIGEDQGFKVVNYSDRWEEVFVNLDNKTRDMIAAAVPYNPERDRKYLLSDPYAPLPSTILYLDKSKNITSLDDLSDLKIGVLDETVQYDYFRSDEVSVKSVEPYITIFAAIQAMAQGEVDAVAEDAGALRYMMRDFSELEPQYFDYEDIHADSAYKVLVVDKDQPELLDKINAGLKNLKEDGTYAELTTKWFGEDLTQAVLKQTKPQASS
ncbi:amino acid ABC transporter substrate-binding protein [Psychrobacter sp. F1192]|uniref:Amino acid ABC transporter substrate-binding protein n=1 Tax=Psychrobacter coccoides TaxID=2818440 RepID=A0ABS3NLK3_9GAMM|nr:transporter substrate-binding domain-containing protein [Psychrobacter coccoides]MBO1530297.1 amino acid ABC transporter substrate-binding protein [Psychrobacter coccoides]